jgi:hypothetical protein
MFLKQVGVNMSDTEAQHPILAIMSKLDLTMAETTVMLLYFI